MGTLKYVVLLLSFFTLTVACEQKVDDDTNSSNGNAEPATRYLYISSGSCYVGGLAASTPARTISRIDLETGNIHDVIVDSQYWPLRAMHR